MVRPAVTENSVPLHKAPLHIAPMHIAIDARRVRDFGIGTYIRNLTRALSALDQENRYTLLAPPGGQSDLAGLGPNFQVVPCDVPDSGVRHNLQLPGYLRSLKASLYHIPLNTVPWRMPRPQQTGRLRGPQVTPCLL